MSTETEPDLTIELRVVTVGDSDSEDETVGESDSAELIEPAGPMWGGFDEWRLPQGF
jgi:hypothetical protein